MRPAPGAPARASHIRSTSTAGTQSSPTSPSVSGSDLGPAPHELLAATLAAYIATMIAMYAQSRGWEIGESSVDVDYDPDSSPRGTLRRHTPP
jgi:uncharacterized OsmC-like protein